MTKKVQQDPLSSQEYLQKGGGICPECRSDQIEGGAIDVDGPTASQSVGCNDCGAEWKDVYHLAGYTDLVAG